MEHSIKHRFILHYTCRMRAHLSTPRSGSVVIECSFSFTAEIHSPMSPPEDSAMDLSLHTATAGTLSTPLHQVDKLPAPPRHPPHSLTHLLARQKKEEAEEEGSRVCFSLSFFLSPRSGCGRLVAWLDSALYLSSTSKPPPPPPPPPPLPSGEVLFCDTVDSSQRY